mgnify:FL=1
MAEGGNQSINVSKSDSKYSKEADYINSVDILIEKLEMAMTNDMELKPYKLKELINDVKTKKKIMFDK